MEISEFRELVSVMMDDASAIIHNQLVIAKVHSEIDVNLLSPLEQDYIYADHYGGFPGEAKRIQVNGVTIVSRILHQTGVRLRDIAGADMLYEIEGVKFALIQYKRATNNRVANDIEQLDRLLGNCPHVCRYKGQRPINRDWLPLRINSYCGCWYSVIDHNARHYVHACEAEAAFHSQKSINAEGFDFGMTQAAYLELFAGCRIGALVKGNAKMSSETYTNSLLQDKHFILAITQQGRWSAASRE